MNPKHFRKEIESSILKQTEDTRLLNHYINGGDSSRMEGSLLGNIQNEKSLPMRDPKGFWYFIMGHSRWGSEDRIGP
jgi:hypothetical protein